jgi:hypothetical protein
MLDAAIIEMAAQGAKGPDAEMSDAFFSGLWRPV